jgi:uncharacterized protein (DUF924 family)
MDADKVITFWFEEIDPKLWWRSDAAFDDMVAERFGELLAVASEGGLADWRTSAHGALAEIIVLDQFSRNIHRGTPGAFANDAMALALAQSAVAARFPAKLPPVQRAFMYLPYMHSESRTVHEVAIELFSEPGLEPNLAAEIRHKTIIDRFGRYPHRNAALGRTSTAEELAFLKTPGSSF